MVTAVRESQSRVSIILGTRQWCERPAVSVWLWQNMHNSHTLRHTHCSIFHSHKLVVLSLEKLSIFVSWSKSKTSSLWSLVWRLLSLSSQQDLLRKLTTSASYSVWNVC